MANKTLIKAKILALKVGVGGGDGTEISKVNVVKSESQIAKYKVHNFLLSPKNRPWECLFCPETKAQMQCYTIILKVYYYISHQCNKFL